MKQPLQLNTRLVIFILLFVGLQIINAQTDIENDTLTEVSAKTKKRRFKIGISPVSVIAPISVNKNKSYSKGIQYSFGSSIKAFLAMTLNDKHRITIGPGFSFIYGNIHDIKSMGDYESMFLNTIHLYFGYDYKLSDKFYIGLQGAVGYLNYQNFGDDNFIDQGTAYSIIPGIKYRIGRKLYITFDLEYRIERLEIDAPIINGRDLSKNQLLLPTLGIALF